MRVPGLVLALLCALPASAQDTAPASERVQIADPYIELRTGPGRGYPVFFVAEKRQWVSIELRRTDWYRVRAEGGQVGWVQRSQLETTLTAAGSTKTFRDLLLDDYLKRRVEFSGGWGRFKGEPMLRLGLQARFADEALAAQVIPGNFFG